MEQCCSICLEECTSNDTFILECKHSFHIHCISMWMIKKTSCPICRVDIMNDVYNNINIKYPEDIPSSSNSSIENHNTILEVLDDWLRMLPEDDFIETILSFHDEIRDLMIEHLVLTASDCFNTEPQYSQYISNLVSRIIMNL